jgi:hypothetical protein
MLDSVPVPYVPAEQAVHIEAPVEPANDPAGQAVQADCRVQSLYAPSAQDRQLLCPDVLA